MLTVTDLTPVDHDLFLILFTYSIAVALGTELTSLSASAYISNISAKRKMGAFIGLFCPFFGTTSYSLLHLAGFIWALVVSVVGNADIPLGLAATAG
ncbi:hypothetical protein D3C87_1799510 [compost metagenome]